MLDGRAHGLLGWGLIATICLCAGASPSSGGDDAPVFEDDPLDEAEVNRAVAAAVVWLQKKQGRDGSWGPTKGVGFYGGGLGTAAEGNPAGPTALALYALLHAAREESDPVIRRGFDYLDRKFRKPAGSYEVSALLLAVTATARRGDDASKSWRLSGRYRRWASALAELLVANRTARGWRYNLENQVESEAAGGPEDLSSTNLAALALLSAARCGLRPDVAAWEDVRTYSHDQQATDGEAALVPDPEAPDVFRKATLRGFAYHRGQGDPDERESTGGMTAAGVANLEMARYVLSDGGRTLDAWRASPNADRLQTSIYDGLGWLHANWSPFRNPKEKGTPGFETTWHLSWLFALGCAMDLLGIEKLGTHDWFAEVGRRLVDRQKSAGQWDTQSSHAPTDTLDTAFAVLFLRRCARGLIPHPSVTGGRREPFVEPKGK